MLKRSLVAFVVSLLWASSAFAQRDAIDLSRAVVHNSPADVASWTISSRVETLTMSPEGAREPGLAMYFNSRSTWPNYTPPGWDGPIQYTIWAGVNIGGTWHVSGIIQMWRERVATGAPLLTFGPGCTVNNFACNWVYDGRWGTMAGYQPRAGEAMIFFATAGNARGITAVTSVRQRTNVVMVNLPANDTGVFNFPVNQTDLLIDLGASGLWTLLDTTTSTQVNAGNPNHMAVGDIDGNRIDEVVADFGTGVGVWIRWNGAGWTRLHNSATSGLTMGDLDANGRSDVILNFPGGGIWAFLNGSTWGQIHSLNAVKMLVADIDGGGGDLILEFAGLGVWARRHTGAWFQVHQMNPTAMTAGDYDASGRDDVAFAFPGAGVWMFRNGTSWLQVNSLSAVRLTTGNLDGNFYKELLIDFGAGYGVWAFRNMGAWVQIHSNTSEQLLLTDLDGNGLDEVVVDFGAGAGVWILANSSQWINAYYVSPEWILAGNFN